MIQMKEDGLCNDITTAKLKESELRQEHADRLIRMVTTPAEPRAPTDMVKAFAALFAVLTGSATLVEVWILLFFLLKPQRVSAHNKE
jgi:hypothetical protein